MVFSWVAAINPSQVKRAVNMNWIHVIKSILFKVDPQHKNTLSRLSDYTNHFTRTTTSRTHSDWSQHLNTPVFVSEESNLWEIDDSDSDKNCPLLMIILILGYSLY